MRSSKVTGLPTWIYVTCGLQKTQSVHNGLGSTVVSVLLTAHGIWTRICVGCTVILGTLMGFSFFFVVLWKTEVSVLGRTVPPKHRKRGKNLKFPKWALAVLFDGLSWISPKLLPFCRDIFFTFSRYVFLSPLLYTLLVCGVWLDLQCFLSHSVTDRLGEWMSFNSHL